VVETSHFSSGIFLNFWYAVLNSRSLKKKAPLTLTQCESQARHSIFSFPRLASIAGFIRSFELLKWQVRWDQRLLLPANRIKDRFNKLCKYKLVFEDFGADHIHVCT